MAAELDGTLPVHAIYFNSVAFAAVRNDGSVVTSGKTESGGDSSAVSFELNGAIPVT